MIKVNSFCKINRLKLLRALMWVRNVQTKTKQLLSVIKHGSGGMMMWECFVASEPDHLTVISCISINIRNDKIQHKNLMFLC